MENNTATNPQLRLLALSGLANHPAWEIYCTRFAVIVEKEIDAKIFDLKTTDEDRRTLVAARKLLTTTYSPDKMRESMRVQAETEIQSTRSRPTPI